MAHLIYLCQKSRANCVGVRKLLQKLTLEKKPVDKILLQELASEISPLLMAIFQKNLDTGYALKDLRTANVTAIFKKREEFKASNYIAVSLMSICCKIEKHVITNNALNLLGEYAFLTDSQQGFRARRSCETQLLTLAQELV